MQSPLVDFKVHRRDVLECQHLDREGRYAHDGRIGGADNVAGFEVFGFNVGEMQCHVLACDGPFGGFGVDLEAFDGGSLSGGHDKNGVADLDIAGVQSAGDGEGVLNATAEDVIDCHAQRFLQRTSDWFGGFEERYERGTGIP